VCLTFDDGPHPQHTLRLLDILKAEYVTGTFFMVGREMEKHPDVVRRVVLDGHAVGGHSFTHGEPGATSPRQLAEEVDRTERLFAQITGRPSRLFRPPHGKLTAGKLLRLWWRGQRVVLWNVDPKDFACASAAELGSRFDGRPLCGGDVVLLHDNVPHAADVLPDVIRSVRKSKLTFLPVTAWTGE
jgi:peptidoglycan/xylan/chitin deacetylase (PgdA/CDA1 family)